MPGDGTKSYDAQNQKAIWHEKDHTAQWIVPYDVEDELLCSKSNKNYHGKGLITGMFSNF